MRATLSVGVGNIGRDNMGDSRDRGGGDLGDSTTTGGRSVRGVGRTVSEGEGD